ncbi:hypothetical protein [Candidatus Entotheonella palauensis]|uniref:hypothetical protein n=1 Tax=Candidatus Entotheonella palauensis TaxID=93172 RepID=UPI000B7ED467|nr:hypothetical protein [Candidatus Entotheonella palauensis]
MKIETPLHTDHQLDQLAAQFEHWRQTRTSPRERIPQALWDQAVALARLLPYTRVAQHLRLSTNDLKKQMAMQLEPHAAAGYIPTGFVELPPDTYQPMAPTTEIELQRNDGARLRLHAPDTALAAIVKSFLEA